MKKLLLGASALLLSATSQAQTAPKPAPLNVALVVFPGIETLDLTEPLDLLQIASALTNGGYNIYTVGMTPAEFTTSRAGLHLRPDYTFQTMPKPDVLIVPGAGPARIEELAADAPFIAQLRSVAAQTSTQMSVCTGALLLAQAGVLDGHRATTHQMMLDELGSARFPKVRLVRNVRYTLDGNVLTTAGITAGLDGTLALIEKINGPVVATAVANVIEYKRPEADQPAPAPTPAKSATPAKSTPRRTTSRATSPRPRPTTAAASKPTATTAATGPLAQLTDPVCHMPIKETTTHRFAHQGKTYGFCSEGCKSVFVAKPSLYVQ